RIPHTFHVSIFGCYPTTTPNISLDTCTIAIALAPYYHLIRIPMPNHYSCYRCTICALPAHLQGETKPYAQNGLQHRHISPYPASNSPIVETSAHPLANAKYPPLHRSEERRVGKECS